MARRKSSAEEDDSTQPSFEQALTGLETIVEEMEHEHLALEDLVAHYEKGSALLSRCEWILQSARDRIELITLRNQHEIPLDSATQSTDVAELPGDSDDDDDNDIRLF
jgi:exodeoxyribonuclease VII small subunit